MNASRIAWGVAVAMGAAVSVQAAGDAWRTDFDAAKEAAAKAGRHLLVDFSGSDWCGWCIRLDDEVFSKPEFVAGATNDFVLCILDFPQKPENRAKIPEAVQKRNQELMKQHGVRGFPTVLLFDDKGALYSRTGYREGGPAPYLAHLADLKKGKVIGDELFAKARQPGLAGADKARALDAALAAVPESMLADHVADMEEVVGIDADGAMGLKAKHLKRLLLEKARVARRARDMAGAIKLYEQVVSETKPTGEELQDLLMEKSSMHYASEDKEAAKKAMDEALAAAPDSKNAERIRTLRAKIFPDAPAKP